MKHRTHRIAWTCLWAMLALSGVAYASDPALQQLENAFVSLGETIRPSVVNIDVKGLLEDENDDSKSAPKKSNPNMDDFREYLKQFGLGAPNDRRMPETMMALGSGFIYDKEGHIITNNHVVANADTVKVRLFDGKVYDAKVVGKDKDTDLAVIKIDAPDANLKPLPLGDSDALKVGQFAIAAGSPRGLENSLSFGHISALGRGEAIKIPGLRFYNLIQTDAAINLGNSGGPLCDINGNVIGINTAIVWGAESLGFAVPVNTAKKVIPVLIKDHKVSRGYLGVRVRDVKDFGQALGLSDEEGALVDSVTDGGAAAKAGVKPYDIIRKVNGGTVKSSSDLVALISDIAPGKTAALEIWRDGKAVTLDVTLAEYQGETAEPAAAEETKGVLGLKVEANAPDPTSSEPTGVTVTDVEYNSPAEEAGIAVGDVITEIAKTPVNAPADFQKLIKEHAKPGAPLLIRVSREGDMGGIRMLKVPADFKP